jgi:hypothetical protein
MVINTDDDNIFLKNHKQNLQKVLNVLQGSKCCNCNVYLSDKNYEEATMIRYKMYVCSKRCEIIANEYYKNVPY